MVQTDFGTKSDLRAILRHETGQGVFLAFSGCLEFNGGNCPFSVTQIGSTFRNEIAPRNWMACVREVMVAEVEYFVREDRKDCANCVVEHLQLLLSRRLQKSEKSGKL